MIPLSHACFWQLALPVKKEGWPSKKEGTLGIPHPECPLPYLESFLSSHSFRYLLYAA